MAQQNVRPGSSLLRVIIYVILALIVIVGLAVLITWLVIRPRKLVYSVDYGSVSSFNISRDHLTANFDFVLNGRNPNHRVTVYYDSIEVRVVYEDQTMAYGSLEPFHQPHKNVTRLEAKLLARSVPLVGSISRDLRRERASGDVEFGIYLDARVRFKVGSWKSGRRKLRVKCDPVLVHVGSTKHFESTPCDVDL
uniref:Late embryogenesis abundant protein LEA-2 subgroup domain-containing protein n=1 Tax=Kalanchoe fedtschenkoi TaxID=63787 RepID=A0A7N0U8E4_KALFE